MGNYAGQQSSEPTAVRFGSGDGAVIFKTKQFATRPPLLYGTVRRLHRTLLVFPMEDFRETYMLGCELGRGQFGVTDVVAHRKTGDLIACK
ncbi:hypothetical protein HPP92_023639 [Vanilla planifolia]|uniref:Uncharacterized protein n=1 Tax=Vanilla planifolia TaxID=51239 RepID=A0A835PPA3_VANPL|nr:hypothetical protein HPP92_023970 [Vanilla planifolia]KAG0455851.1 hypothetical protein HPP92_023639 [Vanilla planifolia]